MLDKLKFWWQGKRVTPATVVIVAASCLVLGLGVSPGIHLVRPAVADALPARPALAPTPVALTSSTPSSFADLAARLSPTVVNVKVVKVEKVGSFQAFPPGRDPRGAFQGFFQPVF